MQGVIIALVVLLLLVATITVLSGRKTVTVFSPNVALVYIDGQFDRELGPGKHVWFDWTGRTTIVPVAKSELPVALGEMTVMSRDQFSFRVALAPVFVVDDSRAYRESIGIEGQGGGVRSFLSGYGLHPAAHSVVAAAALEATGTLSLAELLAAPKLFADRVREALGGTIPGAGVRDVVLTAINLPPEVRKMFTDVERAKMEAQAAVERARGEQAALRVLSNAARMLSDNPSLANLRLLQAVETSKGATSIIIGDGGKMPLS